MSKLFFYSLMLIFLSCTNKETVRNQADEIYLKTFTNMTNDQVMCAKQICVTEEELYQQKGSPLYAQEDKLFHLKYKLAKEILFKKVLNEKLLANGKNVAEYERELYEKLKVSDLEIENFLKRLQFTNVSKGSEEWMGLQKSLTRSKIQEHYLKMLNEYSGTKKIFVKIPKKARPQVQLPFHELIRYGKAAEDELKITMVFNPAKREQRNLVRMVESLSDYFVNVKKNVSFYYLPFSTGNASELIYQKFFICSLKHDKGVSYKTIMDVSKLFDNEAHLFEFLITRKIQVSQLKSCMASQEIAKNALGYNQLLKKFNLIPMVQIIYDNELEFQIPGLLELNQRIEDKLKLKVLQKSL